MLDDIISHHTITALRCEVVAHCEFFELFEQFFVHRLVKLI